MKRAGGMDRAKPRQRHDGGKVNEERLEHSGVELAVVAEQVQSNGGFSKVGSAVVDVASQTALNHAVCICT